MRMQAPMLERRDFVRRLLVERGFSLVATRGTAAALAGASAVSGRVQAASIPEAPSTKTTTMQLPIFPTSGPDYQPVVTLNGWTLPWRMNGDWKEFHLVADLDLAADVDERLGARLSRRVSGTHHRRDHPVDHP